jgi:hypothetical protein
MLILVEGETEETFVNEVLRSHLSTYGYESVSARIVGNARQRDRRGGIRPWNSARRDIIRHLQEDSHCLITTMVDYYGLPDDGLKAWPGRSEANNLPFIRKAKTVEIAVLDDIGSELGKSFVNSYFIPFVVMHEFEGILFSDCHCFGTAIGHPDLIPQLQEIRDQFDSPEEINDSPITAPSKRIEGLIANYQKPILGTLAALEIGLPRIRTECPHFREWIENLEAWPSSHS